MSFAFADLSRSIAAAGSISSQDMLALRRLVWNDGRLSRDEAEALFAVNRTLRESSGEWVDFFVEAVAECVLNGSEPRGMCSQDEAEWLIGALDADGRLETMAELELLVAVIEKARNVPDALKHYALRQIEAAVLTGTGPTRWGGELSDTHITGAECRILRRIIFASGGHGAAAVSRYDAEMLYRLKDATPGADNSPEWLPLFVDGVANYLRGFMLANAQLSHERMRELESFIADNRVQVGRFVAAMANASPDFSQNLALAFGKKRAGPDYAALARDGDQVTENELAWLYRMVDANGEVDAFDRALIEQLKQAD